MTPREQPTTINTYINQIHKNIMLNPTYEYNGNINFLGLLIICRSTHLEIDIFRKPTTTDTTINFCSNHRVAHKMAAFIHITRMPSLPLTPMIKQKE
jgi:hypothetical protein